MMNFEPVLLIMFIIHTTFFVNRDVRRLSPDSVVPSEAFLEQLRRVTPWRLKKCELITFENYKSF